MANTNNKEELLRVEGLKKYFPVKANAFTNEKLSLKAVDDVSFSVYKGETLGLVGESGCGKTTVGRTLLRLYEPNDGRIYLDPKPDVVKKVHAIDQQRHGVEAELAQLENEHPSVDGWVGRFFKNMSQGKAGTGATATAEVPVNHKAIHKKKVELKKQILNLKMDADEVASGHDFASMGQTELKPHRKDIQMIFQDPWASLNPTMMVRDIIGEGPREFKTHKGKDLDRWVNKLLDVVGLPSYAGYRYPHEFSGGQRQRICVARALALMPKLVVCDEPVSALDVSIQAQVINLLLDLQQEFDLTYIFIAHDLSVVEYVSDRIAVMYLGKMVETAKAEQLYENPRHPYTISLLSAIPVADPNHVSEQIILEGDVPSPINPPKGCTFHPRCRHKTEKCTQVAPILEKDQDGHLISCHNPPND